MQLFYNSDVKTNDTHFTFDTNESKHIITAAHRSFWH